MKQRQRVHFYRLLLVIVLLILSQQNCAPVSEFKAEDFSSSQPPNESSQSEPLPDSESVTSTTTTSTTTTIPTTTSTTPTTTIPMMSTTTTTMPRSTTTTTTTSTTTTTTTTTTMTTPTTTTTTVPAPVVGDRFEGNLSPLGSALVAHRNIELASGEGVGASTAIKVLYVGNSQGSERVLVNHPLPPAPEYTLQFDVKFCSGFDFAKGGKLHGLGPVNLVSGGNAVYDDEWSARAMFGGTGSIKTYTYHQNLAGQYGDTKTSSGFAFQPGRYYALSYHVKVNDPASAANGFMRIYVDGVERVRHDNIQFRGVGGSATLINTLMFNTFHGGHTSEWAPRNADGSYKTDCAYFDNFAAHPSLQIRSAPGK